MAGLGGSGKPLITFPRAGSGGSGWPPLTSPMAGSGGLRTASMTATWPALLESKARETTAALRPASSAPTVVPPLTVTAQPLVASTVTAQGTQSGPSYTPQGSGIPWGPWFPQPIIGRTPCPTQEQQPLPPWLQPLSSLQQLATLGLAQALPARMPFGPGSVSQPLSSGVPHSLSAPRGASSSTPGPSLGRSSWQQSPMQPEQSLAPGSLRDRTPESDSNSSQGSEWDGASEEGLDEPPADQQLWSFADLLSQLGECAPSALVQGGGEVSQSQAPCLTAAELALGTVAQPLPPSSEFEQVTHGGYGLPWVWASHAWWLRQCAVSRKRAGPTTLSLLLRPFWAPQGLSLLQSLLGRGSLSSGREFYLALGDPQCHPAPLSGRYAPDPWEVSTLQISMPRQHPRRISRGLWGDG